MINTRDIDIIKHMVKYCEEVERIRRRLGSSYGIFISDELHKLSMTQCIAQLGELAKYLQKNFKNVYNQMLWNKIIKTRNIIAHHYDKINFNAFWKVMQVDMLKLKEFCQTILASASLHESIDETKNQGIGIESGSQE